jgi:hypothetical protein
VIENLAVPHSVTGPCLGQQVRRIAHRLEPTGNDHLGLARADLIRRHHDRLEARAAHLVDGCGGHRGRDPGAEGGLPCGRLSESCWQHAAHDDFLHIACGES